LDPGGVFFMHGIRKAVLKNLRSEYKKSEAHFN